MAALANADPINLGSHRGRAVRAAIRAALFSALYSPDLNPIEQKWRTIGALLDGFTRLECANAG
jgi:transposase